MRYVLLANKTTHYLLTQNAHWSVDKAIIMITLHKLKHARNVLIIVSFVRMEQPVQFVNLDPLKILKHKLAPIIQLLSKLS